MLFADWFEPGYKAGGPIRSCLNFAKQMQDNYNILVFTSDRDLNEQQPYQQIVTGEWIQFDKNIRVFYCPASQLSARFILEQIRKMKPDFIYLNSMYSKYFTIYPLLLRKGGFIRQPIVLSPRGMLKPSAVQFKKTKKKIFLSLMRLAGMQKLIHFHATDQAEQEDIRANFGNKVKITQAANFGGIVTDYPGAVTKTAKELSVVFVGRIHPVKNLDYLLDLLSAVEGRVSLTVIGSEEDKSYSIHCKQLVNKLPGNIQVHFTGEIPNNDLPEYMRQHHIFALPTRGENFGHAIFEALSAGKPVLISDQTPWRHLQMEKAGWDIDLKDKKQFLKALQQAIDLEQHQYNEWSKGAWQLAHQFSLQPGLKEKYFNLF
jgi:glycosyltransferase involved in cell wall biosynthesis